MDNSPPQRPYPKMPLEEFASQFKSMREVVETDEWKDIYSIYYDLNEFELSIVKETDEEVEAYPPEKQIQEIIKCANSFEYFCTKYVRIAHPTRGLIPFYLYRYQRRVIESYENNRFNILSKFRQGGLTTGSIAWGTWRCLFKTDQKIMVVSKSDREAITAGEVSKTLLENLPAWMKPQMSKCNEHERQFADTGSTLWCYTIEAARGKSITVLIIDEAAFIKDMDKHWKAIFPTISTGGICCVVSTVNGVGNWYEKIYHEAESGDNNFNIVEMDYWEHPDYSDPKWVAQTKPILGEKGWAQEVLRSFLGSGETYIPAKILAELVEFTRNNRPIRTAFSNWCNEQKKRDEVETGALWIWREPVEAHNYILAADCAEGVGENGDNSCFQILDESTLEQVAEFSSNIVPPHIFAQIIYQIGIYYNTAQVVIEAMNIGGAVVSALQHDLGYENLYYESKGKQQVAGVKTGKSNRPAFLETIQNRLMNGVLRINSKRFVDELATFIFNPITKKPEAMRGKHDDAIMAMALALFVRDSQMRGLPIGEISSQMNEIMKSDTFEQIRKEIISDDEDWIDPSRDDMRIPDEDGNIVNIVTALRHRNAIIKEFGW